MRVPFLFEFLGYILSMSVRVDRPTLTKINVNGAKCIECNNLCATQTHVIVSESGERPKDVQLFTLGGVSMSEAIDIENKSSRACRTQNSHTQMHMYFPLITVNLYLHNCRPTWRMNIKRYFRMSLSAAGERNTLNYSMSIITV